MTDDDRVAYTGRDWRIEDNILSSGHWFSSGIWWAVQDLNLRPLACHGHTTRRIGSICGQTYAWVKLVVRWI